jgi:PAS domain S-box-containing protein
MGANRLGLAALRFDLIAIQAAAVSDFIEPSAALHSRPPPAVSPEGLADRFELAAIALDRTRMPIAITNPRQPDNPIVLANQAFLDLTGYSANEIVGRNCRFLQGQGTSQATVAEIGAAVAEEREFTVEILNYRKDGTAFWNQLHISPIHDDDGRLLYFFASQDDVTEFRKVQGLEATEHRLLKEVNHRARNVLAVVNGIVRLSRSDNAALYAAAIQQRVQALAALTPFLRTVAGARWNWSRLSASNWTSWPRIGLPSGVLR